MMWQKQMTKYILSRLKNYYKIQLYTPKYFPARLARRSFPQIFWLTSLATVSLNMSSFNAVFIFQISMLFYMYVMYM